MIRLQKYKLDSITLNNNILHAYITKFWNEIFTPIIDENNNKHLYIMCKLKFEDPMMGYRTLGHLRIANYSDRETYISYLQGRLELSVDDYITLPLAQIQFSYIIKEGIATNQERMLLQDISDKGVKTQKFSNINIPLSMDLSAYGEIEASTLMKDFTRYIINDNKRIFRIDIFTDTLTEDSGIFYAQTNVVKIISGGADLTWTDTKLDEGFKRVIGKSEFVIVDGEKVLKKQYLSSKAITKRQKVVNKNNSFITMDIETIFVDGEVKPYLINAYDGEKNITSYAINTALDQVLLFSDFMYQLLETYNDNLIIYAHNFSGFDGIFLLKHLLNYGEIKPRIFNGKLISIELKSEKGINIVFKDSFLMLPQSLRKLCEAFNVKTSKGYFPFLLDNIFYKGRLPKFSYWSKVPVEIYHLLIHEYTGKVWDFKEDSIKYCKMDCIALHEILTKFNDLIFNEFKVNMTKVLTLPALAMLIYRTNFIKKDTIYQILGDEERAIRTSYTGGAVDVYIPNNKIYNGISTLFNKIYYYDVNSLYPFVMSKLDMPIGKPIAFEGNILNYEPDAFGYFYCKITSPEYLKHPIIQRKVKTKDGTRTIAGLGTWRGYIFSEEMRNAIKYGYKFEVFRGYQFERGNVFKEYVEKMYNLRLEYLKSHPMNMIAKLLMNSLYGKFGMKLTSQEIGIYDCSTDENKEDFKRMLEMYGESITDYIQINDKFLIVRDKYIKLKYDEEEDMYHGLDVNIAIASAVTSYARIHMSQFKNNPNYNLYYSDTDSIVIDNSLPDKLVGDKLGQLKLEHDIERGIFLAPKVYGLINSDGEKVIKAKGISKEYAEKLTMDELEVLLTNNKSLEFNQEKWYKKVVEGTIKIPPGERNDLYIKSYF